MRRLRRLAGATIVIEALAIAGAASVRADIPGSGIATGLFDGVSGWAFDKVADGIAKWVLGAVDFFVSGAVDFLRSSVRPDVESAWFAGPNSPYATVRNIAGLLLVGFVFLGIVQGLLHGDAVGMVRRVVGNLPLAVAGMVVTTAVVGRLLELTDALSNAVLSSGGSQSLHFLSGFGATATSLTSGFAAVLLGLVAVVAALLLWIELIVRSALVYLLVAISPLGFAATLWPAARGFLRKTIELLVAVILSKFVIAVALAIGVAALSGAGSQAQAAGTVAGGAGAGLSTLLVGAVLLGLAAFAPFIVLKLIPIAEAALLAQGISRGPARTAQTGLSTYSSVRMASRLSGTGSRPSSGGSGAPAGPPPGAPGPTGGPSGGAPSPRPSSPGGAGAGASAGSAAAGPAAAVAAGAAVGAAAGRAGTDRIRRTSAAPKAPEPDRKDRR